MATKILWLYEEYCVDCICEGIIPKSFPQWLCENKD